MDKNEKAFENFVVKETTDVYGTTTILHKQRTQLKLSTAEYVMADFIAYANSKNKPASLDYAKRRIGIKREKWNALLHSLIKKQIIIMDIKGNISVTRLWLDAFMIGEEWFEAFWLVKNKPFWPGSKKDAHKKFIKVCKKFDPEYIIRQRDAYIKFLAHPKNEFRSKMGAPVFLNPQTERFNEDWNQQLKDLDQPQKKPRKINLSKEKKEELFS